MHNSPNPVRLVKELKGAPLAVLVLLSFSPVPVSRKWIEVHCGYSDKPVTKALYYLQENGFITKTAAGWKISDKSHHFPFPVNPDPDSHPAGELPPVETGSAEVENRQDADSGVLDSRKDPDPDLPASDLEGTGESPKNRNFSASPLISSGVNLNSQNQDSNIIRTTNRGNRHFSGSQPVKSPPLPPDGPAPHPSGIEDPYHRLVAGFLVEHGITLNRRTRALLGKITCDDILSVANDLQKQGMQGETGLFVVRLEQRAALGVGGPPPEDVPNEDFRRYSRGKYKHLLAGYEDENVDTDDIDMDPGDDYDPVD